MTSIGRSGNYVKYGRKVDGTVKIDASPDDNLTFVTTRKNDLETSKK
jgi:hypothetical protein